jgi:hypothetical protein
MQLGISVAPLGEGQESSFSDLKLFHTGCSQSPMKAKRNPATNQFNIRCDCGLELLLVGIEAQTQFTYTAINGQPQTLSRGTYVANVAEIESVSVVAIESD